MSLLSAGKTLSMKLSSAVNANPMQTCSKMHKFVPWSKQPMLLALIAVHPGVLGVFVFRL